MNYTQLLIKKDVTIRQAMSQLDLTAKKILFVVDSDALFGTLTDGDVRRFLLREGKMEDPIAEAVNRHPHTAKTVEEAQQLLQEGLYTAIPVVDDQGRLTEICLAGEGQNDAVLPKLGLPVVIMAGGKGTRLEPYTKILPKPLIPVGDLPIIEHIMGRFTPYSCDQFHMIVNYKKQLMKAYFSECEHDYTIHWYDEDKPLGTGGGLSLLKGTLKETFFLINCDILLLSDYDAMLRFHRESGNTVTMIAAYQNVTIPYGVIDIGEGGVIENMREKPQLSFLTNTGMYIVEPEVLEDIEEDTPIGFPDIIERQRQKGRKVAVFPVSEGEWLDMGQMDALEAMRKRLYGK